MEDAPRGLPLGPSISRPGDVQLRRGTGAWRHGCGGTPRAAPIHVAVRPVSLAGWLQAMTTERVHSTRPDDDSGPAAENRATAPVRASEAGCPERVVHVEAVDREAIPDLVSRIVARSVTRPAFKSTSRRRWALGGRRPGAALPRDGRRPGRLVGCVSCRRSRATSIAPSTDSGSAPREISRSSCSTSPPPCHQSVTIRAARASIALHPGEALYATARRAVQPSGRRAPRA